MDDLLEAQGYVVAQDRLWQMDMARRFAAGELAELLGSSVVEHDKLQRVLQIRPAAERLTATMPEDQKRLFEAFARGVNAYIASHQDNLPAEFRLLDYKPRPWQPVDSWLVALNMVARLDTLYPWKLERAQVEAKLAPNLIAQLYPTTTWRDHPPTQSIPDLTAPQQNIPDVPLDESQTSLAGPVTPAGNSQSGIRSLRRLPPRLQRMGRERRPYRQRKGHAFQRHASGALHPGHLA